MTSDKSKEIVAFLFDRARELSSSAKADRSKLAKIGRDKVVWENVDESPDCSDEFVLLGDAEVITDAIAGVATTYLSSPALKKDSAENLKYLNDYGIYKSNGLREWMLTESENYESFSTYLNTMELLRLMLIKYFQEAAESDD